MLVAPIRGGDVGRVQAEVVGVRGLIRDVGGSGEECLFAAVEESGNGGEESDDKERDGDEDGDEVAVGDRGGGGVR